MKFLKLITLFSFSILFFSCDSEDPQKVSYDITINGVPYDTYYDGYTLEWSDEFNGEAIDTDNWTYELGDGTDYGLKAGWGNNELQSYTNSSDNSHIKTDDEGNSVLAIVANKTGDMEFSSAKLTTKNLQSFRFGRIEARVKVPTGQGMWPAFWMLGESHDQVGWPGSGEIDIFEVIGHEPSITHASAHWVDLDQKKGSSSESIDTGVALGDDYHIYRLDWTPEELVFTIDDEEVNRVPITAQMKEFLRPFYLILNVAVGGNWPGSPDETTEFPAEMLVDWVRAYSIDDLEIPEAPAVDVDEETLGIIYDEFVEHTLNESAVQFLDIGLKIYGDGGEPTISESDIAVMGDSSLSLDFPGESWGGAFFVNETSSYDMSAYAGGNLVFSINKPESITDFEIKLESGDGDGQLYLINYTGVEVANGFVEYTIPLQDFVDLGLNLSNIFVPFAIWNPVNSDGNFQAGLILVDNIYFE
jgi:beta-glucanase (GH16 family)